jgi:NIMA (never in mitosis gene a)-related kinase
MSPTRTDVSGAFASLLVKHAYVGIKKIGEGAFGVAVLAEDKDGAKFVCKMVNLTSAKKEAAQEAKNEARLLAKLKHPYIVRYRESFADRGWLCIVMDFCEVAT